MTINNTNNIKDNIHEFLDGNLSDSEKDHLWSELLGSPDDLDYLTTLATLKKMGQDGAFNSESKKTFTIFSLGSRSSGINAFKPYLAAASALIIVMLILFNIFTSSDSANGISPIAMIEYEIERSAEDLSLFENHLQQAFTYSAAGDLDKALNQLELASAMDDLSEYQKVDLLMVEGAVLYNSGEFSNALEVFDSVTGIENIDFQNLEKGRWYLANTQIQLGMMNEAEENIKKVIELDGAFSRMAKQTLANF